MTSAVSGAYRHIDEHGRVTKVEDKSVNEWTEALEKAQRQVGLPSIEESAFEVARQLYAIRKVLEGLREDYNKGWVPEEEAKPVKPPKAARIPHKALFDMLEQLGYKVRISA